MTLCCQVHPKLLPTSEQHLLSPFRQLAVSPAGPYYSPLVLCLQIAIVSLPGIFICVINVVGSFLSE